MTCKADGCCRLGDQLHTKSHGGSGGSRLVLSDASGTIDLVIKYVDLFSGCGGLSLGVERAGGELVLAVEKSDMAARTFFHNLVADASNREDWQEYISSSVHEQVKRGVLVRELSVLLEDDSLMQKVAAKGIDLVAGGPPCQGFSLAGRRNRDDVRNKLPWEFLEFVAKVQPKAVVIENVVGMNQRFSPEEESSFVQLQQALAETAPGYTVQGVLVNAMHYGAPQYRPRLMILAVRSDVALRNGVSSSGALWRSDFLDKLAGPLPDLAPVPTVNSSEVRTVEDAIYDLSLNLDKTSTAGNRAYLQEMDSRAWGLTARGDVGVLNHVPRKHNPKTTQRFRLYQFLANAGFDQRMVSRAAKMPESDALLYIKTQLVEAELPASAPDGTTLATTLDELCELVMSLSTKKHSQKVLAWAAPARTVVTLPDDYVHPVMPRIFTVREMARFQGFPSAFEFLGKETTGAHRRRVEVPQYSQVGNAVSPWLSWAVGKRITEVLMRTGSGESAAAVAGAA